MTTGCGDYVWRIFPFDPGFPTIELGLENCDGSVDIGVQVLDSSSAGGGRRLLSYLFESAVTISDGGVLDLSSRSYSTDIATMVVGWNHFDSIEGTDVACSFRTAGRNLFQIADHPPITYFDQSTIMLTAPHEPHATNYCATEIQRVGGGVGRSLYTWGPSGMTLNIDRLNAVGEISSAVTAPAARTVTWGAGPGATPDFVVLGMRGGQMNERWVRKLALPFAGTSVVLPLLPPGLERYDVIPVDGAGVSVGKLPGGYDHRQGRDSVRTERSSRG